MGSISYIAQKLVQEEVVFVCLMAACFFANIFMSPKLVEEVLFVLPHGRLFFANNTKVHVNSSTRLTRRI